jgi:hypothetical protein
MPQVFPIIYWFVEGRREGRGSKRNPIKMELKKNPVASAGLIMSFMVLGNISERTVGVFP